MASAIYKGSGTSNPLDNPALSEILDRIRRYTVITEDFTVPSTIGGTDTVTIDDATGFAPTVPVCLFRTDTVGGGGGYAQLLCTGKSGNTLTLQRGDLGLVTETGFLDGDIIAPIIDNTVNIYGGIPTAIQSGEYKETFGSVFIASPAVAAIPLFTAPITTLIRQMKGLKLSAGTATLSIKVDGVSVTGLNAIAVTTTAQTIDATALNIADVGDRVTVDITAVSSAANLEFTLMAEVG